MDYFPGPIRSAMRDSGAAATCLPVRLQSPEWETAVFVHVAGPECKLDRRVFRSARRAVPIRLETELMTHEKAAVVMMRMEILTMEDDPLCCEILLTPGDNPDHYECLKLLARQDRLCWFFGDGDYRIIGAQQQEIDKDAHARFEQLARESFAHDSLIRMAGQYDSRAAIAEIAAHYQPRGKVHDTRSRKH